MSDRVAKQPLGSLKGRENNFCDLNHLFQVLGHCSLFIQRFLLLLIQVTEASIPVCFGILAENNEICNSRSSNI